MTEFEDNLWRQVVHTHGHELARTTRPLHTHRRASRPQLLAGTTVGLAAAATVAVWLFGASTSPPAFAVTRHADGTVTVKLRRSSGIPAANAKLTAMGVRAQIALPTKTPPQLVCPGGSAPTVTFDPASIPRRDELVIAPGQPGAGNAAALKGSGGVGDDAGPGTPGSANHVIRLQPGGGKIRTQAGAGNHVARMYCP